MSKQTTLKAEPRARTGSGRLNQMRLEGWVPSVIYGRGTETENLKVDARTFAEVMAHSTSENIVINLDIAGRGTRLAFLQAVQHDPISAKILHADFLAIDEKTEITGHVPVTLTGESVGVKAGGVVVQYIHALEITCLPNDLPEGIEIDISPLAIGSAIHIGDVKLPSGVTSILADDVLVVQVDRAGSGSTSEDEEEEEASAEEAKPEAAAKPTA